VCEAGIQGVERAIEHQHAGLGIALQFSLQRRWDAESRPFVDMHPISIPYICGFVGSECMDGHVQTALCEGSTQPIDHFVDAIGQSLVLTREVPNERMHVFQRDVPNRVQNDRVDG